MNYSHRPMASATPQQMSAQRRTHPQRNVNQSAVNQPLNEQEPPNGVTDHEEHQAYDHGSDTLASKSAGSFREIIERTFNVSSAQKTLRRTSDLLGAPKSSGHQNIARAPQTRIDLTYRKAPYAASYKEKYRFYKAQYKDTLLRLSLTDQEHQQNRDQYLVFKDAMDVEVDRLKGEIGCLHDEIHGKNSYITDLVDETRQIRQAAGKLQINMSRKDAIFAVPPPDDIIMGRIYTILNKIKTWSTAFASTGPVSTAALNEDDLPQYRMVFLGITDLESLQNQFQDKKRRRLFVRGWAAYIICNAVFPASSNKYHPGSNALDCGVEESSAKSIAALETTIRTSEIPSEIANNWRALTFRVFSNMNESKTSEWARIYIREQCKRVTAVIQPWAKLKPGCEFSEVEAELISIFEEAVQVSHMLRQQRAYWTLRFPQVIRTDASAPGGVLLFDKTTMVDDNDEDIQSQRFVEIVVTPAVFKQGTADGEQFDICTCLHSATVVVQT